MLGKYAQPTCYSHSERQRRITWIKNKILYQPCDVSVYDLNMTTYSHLEQSERSHHCINFTNLAMFRLAPQHDKILSLRSGFAYGRSKTSPDSEQIECTVARQHARNSESVEQIQDSETIV